MWVTRERLRRVEALSTEVNSALDDAVKNRDLARLAAGDDPTPWVRAIEAARRAEALVARPEASEDLRTRVRTALAIIEQEKAEAEAAEKDRRMVERLAGVHNDLGVHQDQQKADAEYAAAFRGYGVDVDALEPQEAGAILAASPVAPELANALDQWAFLRRGRMLRNTAGATGSSRSPRRPTLTPGVTGSATRSPSPRPTRTGSSTHWNGWPPPPISTGFPRRA